MVDDFCLFFFGGETWRIIPGLGYVAGNHGDRKSPWFVCLGGDNLEDH